MKTDVDINALAQQVVDDARQSAAVIGRLSPFFHVPLVPAHEERIAPEESVDIEDVQQIHDIPFNTIDDAERVVVGIDGSQRYCGAIADWAGFIGAVRAAVTATTKTADFRFQINVDHCITLGPYLLPILYRDNQYLDLYNHLLTGLWRIRSRPPCQHLNEPFNRPDAQSDREVCSAESHPANPRRHYRLRWRDHVAYHRYTPSDNEGNHRCSGK